MLFILLERPPPPQRLLGRAWMEQALASDMEEGNMGRRGRKGVKREMEMEITFLYPERVRASELSVYSE